MTSATSGYVTAKENLSNELPRILWRKIPVPHKHAVMISFQELVPFTTNVMLYTRAQDGTLTRLWTRDYPYSDFAQVYEVPTLSVRVARRICKQTRCFRLFFTFFPASQTPQKLPDDGLWNCSVDHYPSFQHHVACNLQTECRDGRDETGHCPFSSPGCKGLVSLCNHCYKFVEHMPRIHSETDINKRANKYCSSVGGIVGNPYCVYSWRDEIKKFTTLHRFRLHNIWIGLYTRDLSMPNMYRHTLMSEDNTALFHSVHRGYYQRVEGKICLLDRPSGPYEMSCDVHEESDDHGAVCQIKPPQNETNYYQYTPVALNTTRSAWQLGQPTLMTCPDGHTTHTFLQCGTHQYDPCGNSRLQTCMFSASPSSPSGEDLGPADPRQLPVPMFTCKDDVTTLSYSLGCNFIVDCPYRSDESFCTHPPCVKQFTCASGQCVPFEQMCDFTSHCYDGSDENCTVFRQRSVDRFPFPSPALISFHDLGYFTATPMNSSEPCPDSHYRCPGALNDCLPVYTKCNGVFDCIGRQDEEECEEVKCPGFFRCRTSRLCLHGDHLCDGWPHCPMNDDELACDIICPLGCLCQGQTFLCVQPVSLAMYSRIRALDATGSNLTVTDISNQTYLIRLVLAKCSLNSLTDMKLLNLRILDLSENKLQHVNVTSFTGLKSLQILSLSKNPLTSLSKAPVSSTALQTELSVVDLSHTLLTVFDAEVLVRFSRVQTLNLTFTSIHAISPGGFKSMAQLTALYMEGSPVDTFPADIFKALSFLKVVTTDNYKFCCSHILPSKFDDTFCHAPKDEISSCKDLLQFESYRGFLWIISCLSVTGNVCCFLVRLFAQSMMSSKSGYSVFVTNLSLADFLMGVYIAIIGVADQWYRGRYLHHDDTWKNSVTCRVAGFLSLLSNEVSALIIWLITVDRFVVLRFPFSTVRFQKTSAVVACLLTWLVGWFLALLPLLPVASHWEFYSQTGICIPLPITRKEFKGRVYSVSVFIILNFILFLFISAGQAFVYYSIQQNALKTNTAKATRDITIARRLITVAVTDFMCWFPIGLCGILALVGIPIPGEMNVAMAIFVLPLNSAINPFMYTFNIVVEKRRKSNESKLLKWMECHSEWIADQ